jgi:hypothetical protein
VFGQEIIGSTYWVNDIVFQVMSIDSYRESKVNKQYEEILLIPPGFLAAVAYRGTLIPNITLDGGVARLTKVHVAGKVFKNPKAISAALGINKAMYAYDMKKIG